MRILYLMQYFTTPKGSYGTRTYEFARRLAANGHEVTVITSNTMMPDYQALNHVVETEIDGIKCILVPASAPYAAGISFRSRITGYLTFTMSACRYISRTPCDVIIASSPPLPISIPGFWGRIRHRAPMVFEVRDLWPEMPIAVGTLENPFFRGLARGLEWLTYHTSAHVVALSPGMAEGVAERGIPENRITTIPNSCDVAFFQKTSNPTAIREKLGISGSAPLVVYAGALGLLNDVDYLVNIADHMRNIDPTVRFLVVGNGVNRDVISYKAQSLGILNNTFHVWEGIPKSEMPDLLAAATVVTSLFVPLEPMWKNSANKFFDGLAAGKPMAINYGGWQADLLDDTGAGIVMAPGDPERGARQLAEFIHDRARLADAAAASLEMGKTRFDRDLMFQKLESVLAQVAPKTP